MDAFDMVRRLKSRRQAILESLPPDLQAEFQQIEEMILLIGGLIDKNGREVEIPLLPSLERLLTERERVTFRPPRVPLADRLKALRDYLEIHGPATRAHILQDTKIPPGTLSALLTDEQFERNEAGLWQVKAAPKNRLPGRTGGKRSTIN